VKWVRFVVAHIAAWGHPFRARMLSLYLDENTCDVRRFGLKWNGRNDWSGFKIEAIINQESAMSLFTLCSKSASSIGQGPESTPIGTLSHISRYIRRKVSAKYDKAVSLDH
jgi:hypothetical protein